MSDDRTPGPTAPRRPAPDPFLLTVAEELGLDPHQVIDGTMRLEWEDDSTKGRTGQVRISWQGSASLPESTINRLRQEARPNGCGVATVESATVESATGR